MQLESSVTLFDDEKVETRFAQLQITADGITSEVSRKVGNDEVISRINQSAEGIQIQANKVNIEGATIFSSGRLSQSNLNAAYDSNGAAANSVNNLKNDLSTSSGTTVIHGGHITTGTLNANAVNANSGTFSTANIPDLNASKITAGDITADRMKVNSIAAVNGNTGTLKINAGKLDITGVITAINSNGTTTIDGGKITTGSISANKIKVSEFVSIGNPSGRNIALGDQSVDIKNGSTILSSFSASGASLGNNSDSAVINLCGEKGSISGAYTNSNNTYNLRIHNNYSLSSNNNLKAIYIENSGPSSSLANRIVMEQTKLYGKVTLEAGSHSIMVDSDEVGISLKGVTVTTTTLTAGGTLYSTGNTMCVNDNSQWCGNSSHRWKAVYALDTSINTSDRKEKDHIKDIDFAKELIMSLEPVEYMWKTGDHRRKRMGFIAQDVAKVCKDLNENLSLVYASYGHEGEDIDVPYYGEDVDDELLHWSLSYDQLIAPMTVVIQQQQEEIDILKTEVANLKGVNNVYSS
jgi:hypothetical protein